MRAVKYINIITHLATQKPSKQFIKGLPVDVIKAISEVALNTQLGNVPLTDAQALVQKKYAKAIRQLSLRSVSVKRKRRFLTAKLLEELLQPAIKIIHQQHGQTNETGA